MVPKYQFAKKKYIFRKMTNADISLVLTCDVITFSPEARASNW